MRLPKRADGVGCEIGISDVLAWRSCPSRAKFGRRRLDGHEAPESQSPATAYGQAIHHCLERLDAGDSHEQAAQGAMEHWRQWLEPSDLDMLYEDMLAWEKREILGVRTLLNEGEISFKLFTHPTEGDVWFRARIDRLYQSLTDPSELVMVDFKSSKHAKSEEEVHADLQAWGYNVAIHEWFTFLYPEHGEPHIQQVYDQLRFGQLFTSKSAQQRESMKRWMIQTITAMIADEEEKPSYNRFCAWCCLKADCPVVTKELTAWASNKIAAMSVRQPKTKKDGTPSKVLGPPMLAEPERLKEYVDNLETIHGAEQVLKAFEELLRDTLKQMPSDDLATLGKRKVERSVRAFSTPAKRQMIDEVGLDTFLHMADVSIAAVDRFYGDDKEAAGALTQFAEKRPGYTVIVDL